MVLVVLGVVLVLDASSSLSAAGIGCTRTDICNTSNTSTSNTIAHVVLAALVVILGLVVLLLLDASSSPTTAG